MTIPAQEPAERTWLPRVAAIDGGAYGLHRIVWIHTGETIRLHPPTLAAAVAPELPGICKTALVWWMPAPEELERQRERKHRAAVPAPVLGALPASDWLKATREALHLSQRDLAALSGLGRGVVCDLESGRRTSPKARAKLGEALRALTEDAR